MKTLVSLIGLAFASQAFAMTVFLQNQWQKDGNRYCEYSGGYILTIKSYELCPMSVER